MCITTRERSQSKKDRSKYTCSKYTVWSRHGKERERKRQRALMQYSYFFLSRTHWASLAPNRLSALSRGTVNESKRSLRTYTQGREGRKRMTGPKQSRKRSWRKKMPLWRIVMRSDIGCGNSIFFLMWNLMSVWSHGGTGANGKIDIGKIKYQHRKDVHVLITEWVNVSLTGQIEIIKAQK